MAGIESNLFMKGNDVLKRFTDGLVFGAGFAIAYSVIWLVAAEVLYPVIVSSKLEKVAEEIPELSSDAKPPQSQSRQSPPPAPDFHELEIDGQIKQASVIALAKFEPAPDGKKKAIIKEFLKKEPGVTVYYDICDEYESASLYPEGNTNYGDGMVIFFTGSPAQMRMSITYYGDRIHGLGDLPVELLREKCKGPKGSADKK